MRCSRGSLRLICLLLTEGGWTSTTSPGQFWPQVLRGHYSKLLCKTWLRNTGVKQGWSQNIRCAVLTHLHKQPSVTANSAQGKKRILERGWERMDQSAPEDQHWDHLLHFQAFDTPFSICREQLVQARADSIYNVFKTTEWVHQRAALKILQALREHHCWKCCSNPLQQDRSCMWLQLCGTWAGREELWSRQLFPPLLVVWLIYGGLESAAWNEGCYRTVLYDQVVARELLLTDDIHRTRTSEKQKTLLSTPCQAVFRRRFENMQFVSSW